MYLQKREYSPPVRVMVRRNHHVTSKRNVFTKEGVFSPSKSDGSEAIMSLRKRNVFTKEGVFSPSKSDGSEAIMSLGRGVYLQKKGVFSLVRLGARKKVNRGAFSPKVKLKVLYSQLQYLLQCFWPARHNIIILL